MRTASIVLIMLTALAACAIVGSAQIKLINSATGGPASATTTGTGHSLDSKVFRIGSASLLRSSLAASDHLPTLAALDPTSIGSGGKSADPGFTIQWWYKPAAPTAFGYLWSDRNWGSFRCFQNGAAGVGEVTVRGPLTACNTTGSVLVNSTNANGWLHLAVTVNTKLNSTTWYVNGAVNNSAVSGITGTGASFVCFGDTGSASGCAGNQDDFRIYNWARTAGDIAADYTVRASGRGPSGSPNVPDLGYYTCDLPISLVVSGAPNPGGTVVLSMLASGSIGLPYQMASSLGTGPIKIGARSLALSLDPLLQVTVNGLLPHVFVNYVGLLDGQGHGQAKINIPSITALIGQRIYSAFVTIDVASPHSIREISSTQPFTISR